MPKRPSPTKAHVAKMKVLKEMGHSDRAIARQTGFSNHTVKKYLTDLSNFDDPEVQELMGILKDKEIDDLTLIGAKSRARLHELLDEGKTKVIETTAVMDRVFQQRRLLEGSSTANVSIVDVVKAAQAKLDQIGKEQRKLESKYDMSHGDIDGG